MSIKRTRNSRCHRDAHRIKPVGYLWKFDTSRRHCRRTPLRFPNNTVYDYYYYSNEIIYRYRIILLCRHISLVMITHSHLYRFNYILWKIKNKHVLYTIVFDCTRTIIVFYCKVFETNARVFLHITKVIW